MMYFIQQQRKNNGHNKSNRHRQSADNQGIAEHTPHIRKAEKINPVFQADKFAFKKAFARNIVKKSNDIAQHGDITEDQDPKQRAGAYQPHLPLGFEGFQDFLSGGPVLFTFLFCFTLHSNLLLT
ncbi:MAG: hypothetical protein ACLVLH_12210 [Eisenbergiella massiliensis]